MNFGNYSTTEQDTGFTWIDGKTIYRKTVHFGNLPDNALKEVNHNITNLSYIVNFFAMAYNGTRWMPMPAASPLGLQNTVVITINATKIIIGTGIDRTADDAYVTLYYTKNS